MDVFPAATNQRNAVFRSASPRDREGFINLDGREFYCIPAFDRLRPFLMTLVSDTDLWMYVSSRGGLTAGRVNENRALFPYETDDRLHEVHPFTGPLTLLRIRTQQGHTVLWQPFAPDAPASVVRNLYKSVSGASIIFEEVNPALGLTFRYRWCAVDRFGFLRTCTLVNTQDRASTVEVLDGLTNLLPAGIDLRLQQTSSCLINAYTRCELDQPSGLGVLALTSLISDRAEPAESLHANVAWIHGLDHPTILLCTDQVEAFRAGREIVPEQVLNGRRGAFLVCSKVMLETGASTSWHIAADAHLDHGLVSALRSCLIDRQRLSSAIDQAILAAEENLERLIASADGLQTTADRNTTAHHRANVLFNIMRGGVFLDNGDVTSDDFAAFLKQRNHHVHSAHAALLDKLPSTISRSDLLALAEGTGDPGFIRLCMEYLPLAFSRRHGDPSRPWNRFSIRIRNDDGTRSLNYQGNWRDIFQNWEALAMSFPAFIESLIAKFVNATTPDGFNPYRITRAGIDWEIANPDDPWSNIGYWGDHQVVYLLKLLEASRRFHPHALPDLLRRPLFSYANVPYRLRPYPQILHDRRNTIDFDHHEARRIDQRVRQLGADGKLLLDETGNVVHVTLLEKLLVPALSKLSNLIVDGGIWMNTQRPEWNDANNALPGNGLSMVTLCYLRRYAAFCAELLESVKETSIPVSGEIAEWHDALAEILAANQHLLAETEIAETDRKRILDELGRAFSGYRDKVYAEGLSSPRPLSTAAAAAFFRLAMRYLDHAIAANRRGDGLYHAYNLLEISGDGNAISLGRLPEMLEGQVAVLSSGVLRAEQSAAVLDAMFASRLYRADQNSFMLYPDRELPSFLRKNSVESADVLACPLLAALAEEQNSAIVCPDADGRFRFNASLRNARDLTRALDRLQSEPRWSDLVRDHRDAVHAVYERVFHHASFTGRSGAMYGYEGIGSIYWHMVSKLLLAAQECCLRAEDRGETPAARDALVAAYYRIRSGLGFNKDSAAYGAFPIDPYSHTPKDRGAQQPGMTGQVKEELLTRFGELGVIVERGQVSFRPTLLRACEVHKSAREWMARDLWGRPQRIALAPESLAFTLCQVPITYTLTDGPLQVRVLNNARGLLATGDRLDERLSASLFERRGEIGQIEVLVPRHGLQL